MMDAVGRCAKAGKILILLTPWILGPLSIQAHEHPGDMPTDAKLGTVSFSISCKSSVQGDFNHAVALLHSFWHSEAQRVFEKVAAADPNCAMAYWGVAMSHFHLGLSWPASADIELGRQALNKAEPATEKGAREVAYIAALRDLYTDFKTDDSWKYFKTYADKLSNIAATYPMDREAKVFEGLALILAQQPGDVNLTEMKQAISVLQPLLQQYPDHPGIAHYLIHATDRPELAAQGLEAARRYAAIAPDSAHALHMPSHIFVRLGLWQDSINSNIAASASGTHAAEMHLAESHYQTHAMDFLSYSYLQSGQEAKAREVIAHTDHVVGANEESKAEHRAYFTARTALELHRWKEAASLPIPPTRKDWLDSVYWARAVGAARSGDVAGAEADVKELTQLVADREKRARKAGYGVSNEKAPDLSEAEAWLAFAKGKSDEALQELRAAADHQDKNGGESVSVPAREMLADMLLELKRADEALSEYKTVLKNSPNRFDALFGAAHAAAYINSPATESERDAYYQHLLRICAPGADRPELS